MLAETEPQGAIAPFSSRFFLIPPNDGKQKSALDS